MSNKLSREARHTNGLRLVSYLLGYLGLEIPEGPEDREMLRDSILAGLEEAWDEEGLYVASILEPEAAERPLRGPSLMELSRGEFSLAQRLLEVADGLLFVGEQGLWPIVWDEEIETAIRTLEEMLPQIPEEEREEPGWSMSQDEREAVEREMEEAAAIMPAGLLQLYAEMGLRAADISIRLAYILEHEIWEALHDEQVETAMSSLWRLLPSRPEGRAGGEEG